MNGKENEDILFKQEWQKPVDCVSRPYKDDDGESFGKDLAAYESMLSSIGQLLKKEDERSAGCYTTPEINPLLHRCRHPSLPKSRYRCGRLARLQYAPPIELY